MPKVTWASVASDNPMGQQHYEVQIQQAIRDIADPSWRFCTLSVAPLRSRAAGTRHSPVGLAQRSSFRGALALGALTYRRRGLLHRLDLRLPPFPGGEVLTVHDVAPRVFPDEGLLPVSAAQSISRARVVICPSLFAADEIRREFTPTRIEVIPLGLTEVFRKPVPISDQRLAELGLPGPFVMHAGGATTRKNLPALAGAWARLTEQRADLTLALCGPPDPRRDLAFAGLPRVKLLGKLDQPDLIGMMCRAAVLVVPSLYEGFGLPALEAMACGTPLVAARMASLPEVCGDTVELVEPTPEGIAAGLQHVLDDRDRDRITEAARIRALSYSWQDAARRHLQVYTDAGA